MRRREGGDELILPLRIRNASEPDPDGGQGALEIAVLPDEPFAPIRSVYGNFELIIIVHGPKGSIN